MAEETPYGETAQYPVGNHHLVDWVSLHSRCGAQTEPLPRCYPQGNGQAGSDGWPERWRGSKTSSLAFLEAQTCFVTKRDRGRCDRCDPHQV